MSDPPRQNRVVAAFILEAAAGNAEDAPSRIDVGGSEMPLLSGMLADLNR